MKGSLRYDWEKEELNEYNREGAGMVTRIRASLQSRLEGRNEGGDIEVMRLVDEIVKKETPVRHNDHVTNCWCSDCDDKALLRGLWLRYNPSHESTGSGICTPLPWFSLGVFPVGRS